MPGAITVGEKRTEARGQAWETNEDEENKNEVTLGAFDNLYLVGKEVQWDLFLHKTPRRKVTSN